MQLPRRYTSTVYLVIAALILSSPIIYVFTPHLLANFPAINWLAFILTMIICVTPWGSKKLIDKSGSTKKLATKTWYGKIISLQCAIFLLYYGITQLLSTTIPIQTQPHPQAFSHSLHDILFHFGLFPWPLIVIFAIGLGVCSYCKQKDSYASTVIQSAFKKQFYESFSLIFNTTTRFSTLLYLAINSAIVSIAVATLIAGPAHMNKILGPTNLSMLATILVVFVVIRRSKSQLLLTVEKQNMALHFIVKCVIWGMILGLLALAVHNLHDNKFVIPRFIDKAFTMGWNTSWHTLSNIWWFYCCPIAAIYIARFSTGYSVRSIIMATFTLPVIIASILLFNNHYHFLSDIKIPAWLVEVSILLGFALLLSLIAKKSFFPLTIQTYLPKPGRTKPRNKIIYLRRWKITTAILFYLFIPAGIFILTIGLMLAIIPGIITYLLILFALPKLLSQKSAKTD